MNFEELGYRLCYNFLPWEYISKKLQVWK